MVTVFTFLNLPQQGPQRVARYERHAIVPATGKNTRSFGVLEEDEIGFYTYMSQRVESEAATVTTSD